MQRDVAVEKLTTHSTTVNDKWKKTGTKLQKAYEYTTKEWESRQDTRLLYNKHTMKTSQQPIQPEITMKVIVPGGIGQVDKTVKYETGHVCERIDSYQLNAVTNKEVTWYHTEKKVRDVVEFDETVKDHSAIEWTNKEFDIVKQDVIIEVDDWELVLVQESHNEQPYILPGIHEDITYVSERTSCGEEIEKFEIEERNYICNKVEKRVKLHIKAERMQTKEYALATLEEL